MSAGFYIPTDYDGRLPGRVRLGRLAWLVVSATLFRCSPVSLSGWRRFLLRLFGARIHGSAVIYPSCRVWAPWNLRMDERACLGPDVDCYSVDQVVIEQDVTVSQGAYLCTASHDIDAADRRLVTAPILLRRGAWIFAKAMIGPGVTVGEGSCVGACAVVMRDTPAYAVVVGNPARVVRERRYRGAPA